MIPNAKMCIRDRNYSRQFGDHDVSALFVFNRKMNESTNQNVMNFPVYEEDWVGRVTYNFKERYLAEFNGAYTGSELSVYLKAFESRLLTISSR